MLPFCQLCQYKHIYVSFHTPGVHGFCPIELSPPRVVVKHGDPVSVNCSTPGLEGIGWEAPEGGTGLEPVSNLPWTVESLTEWGIQPMCFLFSEDHECTKTLEVVLYSKFYLLSTNHSGILAVTDIALMFSSISRNHQH